jgi:cell division protein FtsN
MARDYAKQRKPLTRRAKKTTTRKPAHGASPTGHGWQLYLAGLFSGVFLSFLLYLGSLPPSVGTASQTDQAKADTTETTPPKPRFDFYTLLPEQTMEVEAQRVETAAAHSGKPTEFFLLQAGAFKQREDAESRRAQLLLLNLEPTIEETNGDHGRWYRVTLGPFQSRSKLNKARSLTAAQNIDTLLLKRRST